MVRTPKKSLTRGAQKPIRINKSRVAPLSSSVQVGAQSRPGRSKRCFLMNMIRMVEAFNLFLAVLFTLAYAYQLVYLFLGLIRRKHWKQPEAAQLHRYAAVISARNEAGVIGELIHTLKQQNYPTDLLDVYVVADNCTDDTAQVSRRAGAIVYERFNQHKKGKGYALDYLFRTLVHEGRDQYDGYLIFDADNLVDPNFVSEMNKVFDSGNYGAITCYRNSRNFGANWISAGYAIWFLREARFLNFPRMLLGSNCHVSGTGFLISADVIRENGGWPYHLLTEDIEFSAASIIDGVRISYCPTAVLYDEQPVTFREADGLYDREPFPGAVFEIEARLFARRTVEQLPRRVAQIEERPAVGILQVTPAGMHDDAPAGERPGAKGRRRKKERKKQERK